MTDPRWVYGILAVAVVTSSVSCGSATKVSPAPATGAEEAASPAEVATSRELSPPVKVYTPAPRCTEEALEVGVEATVVVQAILTEEGDVEGVTLLEGSGLPAEMDGVVVDTVRKWQFIPAKLDGEPVRTHYDLTVNLVCGSSR